MKNKVAIVLFILMILFISSCDDNNKQKKSIWFTDDVEITDISHYSNFLINDNYIKLKIDIYSNIDSLIEINKVYYIMQWKSQTLGLDNSFKDSLNLKKSMFIEPDTTKTIELNIDNISDRNLKKFICNYYNITEEVGIVPNLSLTFINVNKEISYEIDGNAGIFLKERSLLSRFFGFFDKIKCKDYF